MELKDKLQYLRREKGLTQEELAEKLYVSRTAVSKWESGRGCPSIDSLKSLADFFGVTVDALLSGEEPAPCGGEEQNQREARFRGRIFGLLDLSAALLWILPLFADRVEGTVRAAALPALSGGSPWLKAAFFAAAAAMTACGAVTLLGNRRTEKASFLINALGAGLFAVGLHPYAAAFLLAALMIKVFLPMTRNVSRG